MVVSKTYSAAAAVCLLAATVSFTACRHSNTSATHPTVGGATLRAGAPKGAPIPGFRFGVVSATTKVRPGDTPQLGSSAELFAARNEFEAFQIVFRAEDAPVNKIAVALTSTLQGPKGARIAPGNVVLYRVAYYRTAAAGDGTEGDARWPDPLIPEVDVYTGQKRKAFPFDVPRGETRAVWVDVLVPTNTPPGLFRGELEIRVAGQSRGTVPMTLQVGQFTLPSTASLKSAFGMDYAQPCMAHTDTDSCDPDWDEDKACELREIYLRAALDHRFTISDVAFQPPFEDSADPFEEHLLPLIQGKGRTRLPGARPTSVRIDDQPENLERWITLANEHGFAGRLFYFPVDRPDDKAEQWERLKKIARQLRQANSQAQSKGDTKAHATARLLLTTAIVQSQKHGVADLVDVLVPTIDQIEGKPEGQFAGNQRGQYTQWLAASSPRMLWSEQSCVPGGCGECGEKAPPRPQEHGWPSRVIEASAVQNRAYPWLAFRYGLAGELYVAATGQLTEAWEAGGLCTSTGSGEGTLLYPGKPSVVGGTKHIPIESIRIKMIREGMEDYEYLTLAAKRDRNKALQISRELFPHAYECAQSTSTLEQARRQLFDLINRR